ncbi:hypothetical protein [Spirosoma pollinicola]|uniref:Lipocalin-like domain-containing protein n=1 Tax=Spirosoma pollinicola TaxID=2057025 RepID=A0A2K8YZL8_9BACT|nr:hypothetical protein [Spirosoma pollinicola]AUD02998.1 hypothetical protein CWM47_14850 [Spirosoma pollinicola]
MRKTHSIAFLSLVTLFCALIGCKGNKVAPVSERIAKVWSASKVDENKVTVYTKAGTANVRNYTAFRLDLSAAPTVKYTDFDNNTFVGKYSVPSDTRLVLTELTPSPTGANGTIEFTINSIDDNTLSLSRTTASQKTGGTTNDYTLTNP